MDSETCFLSGLVIPKSQFSIEHVAPKSKVPYYIAYSEFNLRPAIKIINSIKGDRFLCQWYDERVTLCEYALDKWNLKNSERNCIIKALERFKKQRGDNPCSHCVLSIAQSYCYARPELSKYRALWLSKLNERVR